MSSAPWFDRMTELLGLYEEPGDRNNPVILAMAKACGGKIARTYKHDSIPWCALIVNFVLIDTGFPGNDSLWALDFRKYGKKLSKPVVGAIATKKRSGGGHVFFVVGKTSDGRIIGRGGNQSDMVCDAPFLASELQYNWPTGVAVPDEPLPIVRSILKSRRPVTLAMLDQQAGTAVALADLPEQDPYPTEVSAARRVTAAPAAPITTTSTAARGDPDTLSVQTRLLNMKYDPGEMDGIWGGRTAGVITGFINDRHLSIVPPTSADQFRAILPQLKIELSRAEAAVPSWTRPISPERALATEATVAEKVPAVAPVRQSKLRLIWATIAAMFTAAVNAISDSFQDAMSWIVQFKTYLAGMPGWVWFAAVAAGLAFFAYKAQQGASGVTKTYNEGKLS